MYGTGPGVIAEAADPPWHFVGDGLFIKIQKQVSQNQATLTKIKKNKEKLTNERDDMKDSDYVAKVIRYKYKYTKDGERVYNIKEKGDN